MPLEFYESFIPKLEDAIQSAASRIKSVQEERLEIERITEKIESAKQELMKPAVEIKEEMVVEVVQKPALNWTIF